MTEPMGVRPPLAELLPAGTRVNAAGHVEVGGCDLVDLAGRVGTPAYVYAGDDVSARARAFLAAAFEHAPGAQVLFAIKALPCRAALALATRENLGWEASSSGELRLALDAGANPARGAFTGADKTDDALRAAIAAGLGLLVLDSEDELERAEAAARALGRRQDVLLSITPRIAISGIRHDPETGQLDRKGGFQLAGGHAARAAGRLRAAHGLRAAGVHLHLGARLYDAVPEAIAQTADFVAEHDFPCEVFDVGGGPNVPTVRGSDEQPAIAAHVASRAADVRQHMTRVGRPMPRLVFEPGRSLVGPAGVTVYRVRAVRRGVRTYVSVDGGLHENPRPLIYGTSQDALLANRIHGEPELVSVAGVTAEAGDVLAWDVELPAPAPGDVLVIPATGAYAHAMASNWNLQPRPPVVFCAGGHERIVVRRETHTDVTVRDLG